MCTGTPALTGNNTLSSDTPANCVWTADRVSVCVCVCVFVMDRWSSVKPLQSEKVHWVSVYHSQPTQRSLSNASSTPTQPHAAEHADTRAYSHTEASPRRNRHVSEVCREVIIGICSTSTMICVYRNTPHCPTCPYYSSGEYRGLPAIWPAYA